MPITARITQAGADKVGGEKMANQKPRVLVIDDEQAVCDLLHDELKERGYQCVTALNGNDALTKLATEDFNVALVDIKLPEISGIEVLRKIQSNYPNTVAIMITAVSSIDTVVESMKLGASDYIVKPFDLDRVNTSIRNALETKQVTSKSSTEMDAIARGVEARQELLIGFSKTVTERTIDIARQLGIDEKEIQRWVAARAKLDSERNRVITSSLDKLKRSLLAQSMMGMTELHRYKAKPDEPQN